MPGIYTHNVIFKRVVGAVSRKSSSSYLSKSIVSLFNSPEHMKAGLFGSIGPNLFDYMYFRNKGRNYGNDISFALHGNKGSIFAEKMIDIIKSYKDSRNEWSSAQRAFIMGYISHIIADSMVHPYVFYCSGFPSAWTRRDIIHSRKANLIFQYNIDNYFLYKDEGRENPEIDEMLPVIENKRRSLIMPSVKVLMLQALKDFDESFFNENFKKLQGKDLTGVLNYVPGLDRIPANIRLCYRLKRTENHRLKGFLDRFNSYPFLYSDFFVRYPGYKRVDVDALNLHQGKWQYPAGQKGLRYESVLHLIKSAVDKTAEAWEHIESVAYGNRDIDLKPYIDIDAYTGEKEAGFREMKIKDLIKLRI
jgi:hypothetical protein